MLQAIDVLETVLFELMHRFSVRSWPSICNVRVSTDASHAGWMICPDRRLASVSRSLDRERVDEVKYPKVSAPGALRTFQAPRCHHYVPDLISNTSI